MNGPFSVVRDEGYRGKTPSNRWRMVYRPQQKQKQRNFPSNEGTCQLCRSRSGWGFPKSATAAQLVQKVCNRAMDKAGVVTF